MPISLDYAQTRALAKKFRALTGRDVSHGAVLDTIASVIGMPADGMMHLLKNEIPKETKGGTADNMWDPAWKPGKSTLATFDSLPRHAALAIPALHEALPIFELLIRKAPRRARYSFVLVQFTVLSTTPELALEDLAAQLRRYVTDHKGMAACTGTGEFAILVDDVDAMDEEDPSMNQLGRYIGASWRESTDKPDIMFTAAITDVSFITPAGDLMLSETVGWSRETLMDYEEYRTPASPFSLMWAPSGV